MDDGESGPEDGSRVGGDPDDHGSGPHDDEAATEGPDRTPDEDSGGEHVGESADETGIESGDEPVAESDDESAGESDAAAGESGDGSAVVSEDVPGEGSGDETGSPGGEREPSEEDSSEPGPEGRDPEDRETHPGPGSDADPQSIPPDEAAVPADPETSYHAGSEGDAASGADRDDATDAEGEGAGDADGEAADVGPAAAAATPGADADAHQADGGDEVPVPSGAAAPTPTSPEPVGGGYEQGAPDDQEMPLTDHIEEMIKRLGVVVVLMAIVSAITFPLADQLINFLWYSFLPGLARNCPPPTELVDSADQACPRVYHPLSLMLARLKTASLVGFVIALPVFVYQTYLFMRPGLYPNERRYYLAAVPTSLVLAAIGVAFAYFLVLPVIFTYFLGYSLHAVDTIAFSLSQTFDLILLMMGLFAVVFQIPLFMMLAIMMGVTTRQWLESRRLYFWAAFLGIAFLFSPDPTGMAPIIVALTMLVLFEGTLLLLRWTGR